MIKKYRELAKETKTKTTRLALNLFKEYNQDADKFGAPLIRISECIRTIRFFRGVR